MGHLRNSETGPGMSAPEEQADVIRRKAEIELERQLSAVILIGTIVDTQPSQNDTLNSLGSERPT